MADTPTLKQHIPERHIALCRAIGALAKGHGLNNLVVSFTPAFGDEWRDEITMRWEAGRHDETAGKIFISSNVRVHTLIED